MKIRNKTIIAILALIMPAACEIFTAQMPPYVITKPVFEIIERPYYFDYAGISFNFLNTSEKTADMITVSFMLFDPKTRGNPFIGSNIFEISKRDMIFPNLNREIIISLDTYIHLAPNEPYIIDNFFISEIQYTDGSVWQDKYGIYGTGVFK